MRFINNLIQILTRNLTPFSVLGILYTLFAIPVGLYSLSLPGLGALPGMYLLLGLAIALPVILLDRGMVRLLPYKTLLTVESILLVVAFGVYLYQNRKLTIQIPDQNHHFVIIENDGSLKNTPQQFVFPFNRKITPSMDYVVLSNQDPYLRKVQLETPRQWNGYQMTSDRSWKVSAEFYYNSDQQFEETEKALILQEIMKQIQ